MKTGSQLLLGVLFVIGLLGAVTLFSGTVQVHTRDGRLNLQLHAGDDWHYYVSADLSDVDAGKRPNPEPEEL